MSPEEQNELRELLDGATVALMRAAQRARDLARKTGTKIVVMRNGELVTETPSTDRTADGA